MILDFFIVTFRWEVCQDFHQDFRQDFGQDFGQDFSQLNQAPGNGYWIGSEWSCKKELMINDYA